MKWRVETQRWAPAVFACVLGALLSVDVPATAADASIERGRLAAVLRQLDLVDRLINDSAESAAIRGTRYHLDYARLRADISRVRTGIEQYLTPVRSQPRDDEALNGIYATEDSGQ